MRTHIWAEASANMQNAIDVTARVRHILVFDQLSDPDGDEPPRLLVEIAAALEEILIGLRVRRGEARRHAGALLLGGRRRRIDPIPRPRWRER